MKIRPLIISISLLTLLGGCQSVFAPRIGMTEKEWQRTTLIGDVVYMEGSIKAYRSGGAYYYFKDGILVKIDQGIIPAQKVEMEVRSEQRITTSSSGDLYSELKKLDELRKEGVLTEEEFQMQKKKLLDRKQ